MTTSTTSLGGWYEAHGATDIPLHSLHDRAHYESKFVDHMITHDLSFEDGDEFSARLDLFVELDDLIERHNADNSTTYKLAHNQYSHLSRDEFKEIYLSKPMPSKDEIEGSRRTLTADEHEARSLSSSVDWVTAGGVTGVKDQGSCGSCWAFSTTGAMEGAYYNAKGSLESFSEQQLVSCDTTDSGCSGGLMDYAFSWIKSNGGICSESDYGYTSSGGTAASCLSSCTEVSGTTVSYYTDVTATESSLMTAVAQQPVSVAIEADQTAFVYYSSGVLTGTCGTSLDHGVLAVGYGTDSSSGDYWKVKNSWGTSWGESGYVRIERGSSQSGGQCGILSSASYPTLA